jgi:hypothetical protein
MAPGGRSVVVRFCPGSSPSVASCARGGDVLSMTCPRGGPSRLAPRGRPMVPKLDGAVPVAAGVAPPGGRATGFRGNCGPAGRAGGATAVGERLGSMGGWLRFGNAGASSRTRCAGIHSSQVRCQTSVDGGSSPLRSFETSSCSSPRTSFPSGVIQDQLGSSCEALRPRILTRSGGRLRQGHDGEYFDSWLFQCEEARSGGGSGRHDVVHEHDASPAKGSPHGEGIERVFAPRRSPETGLLLGFAAAFEQAWREGRARAARKRPREECGLIETALDETRAVKWHRDPDVVRAHAERPNRRNEQGRKRSGELGVPLELETTDRRREWGTIRSCSDDRHTV